MDCKCDFEEFKLCSLNLNRELVAKGVCKFLQSNLALEYPELMHPNVALD